MDFENIDLQLISSLALLLLIGMGPKIALVPFLEKTKGMDAKKQREIGTRMVKTAVITALILFATGSFLMTLLHISGGAVSVAGGIVLMLLALKMTLRPDEAPVEAEDESPIDHQQMAIYPLAVPYLLNPVGITVLIITSAEAHSFAATALMVVLILIVGGLDLLIFRNVDKLAKRLNPTTLIVSELVFGILLTAVAVQLFVYGLGALGIIEAAAGH